MEKLTEIFEKLDLTKLVPPMDTLLDKLLWIAKVAVMAGPIVMLVFGLWYLLLPPKEANYGAGFRTWFGMGSVEAWRMTQRIGGTVWSACGLILAVVMWFVSRGFAGGDPMVVAEKAVTCLVWQVAVAFISYIAVWIVMMFLFDSRGCRRGRR
jgi:hypothetical protein